jgi:hypothetical protein
MAPQLSLIVMGITILYIQLERERERAAATAAAVENEISRAWHMA